jgi:hypothetical protein
MEEIMKIYKTAVVSAICATCFVAAVPASAEKMDCSGSKKAMGEQLGAATLKPGDSPDRELVQFERIDILSSRNPEFDGIQERVYVRLDHIGGTGGHDGYAMFPLKSGEKLWARFQGSHYLKAKGDSWELPFVGTYRFIAGTGKYKSIRGGGSYSGMSTPAGATEDFMCSAEY